MKQFPFVSFLTNFFFAWETLEEGKKRSLPAVLRRVSQKRMKNKLSKDCEIEVSSNEDGFKGAWFRATLVDDPNKYNVRKLSVRYLSLLSDDGSNPFQESTYRRFIRPVPPVDLFSAVDFEQGSVVEAFLKDGWWTGVLVKKINSDKFLVYFDTPPDLIMFKTIQLRPHFDWNWNKGEWVRPHSKQLSNKSRFRCGTNVDVMETKGDEVVWVPSIIVKEMEDGNNFIVKSCKYLSWNDGNDDDDDEIKPNRTVSLRDIKLTPPPPILSLVNYKLLESVVVDSSIQPSGNRPSSSRSMPLVEADTIANSQPSSLVLQRRSRNEMAHADVVTNETELGLHVTPSPSVTVTALEQSEAETQENTSSTKIVEQSESSEDNNRKRKREEELISATADSVVVVVEETKTMMVLPFAKKSIFWKTFETMQVLERVPQNPHFSPLVNETREDFREGVALGMMSTFSSLLERFKEPETDFTITQLDSLKDSFAWLENYGFNVATPLTRINKMLALRNRQFNMMKEVKSFEEKIKDETCKRHKAEEEWGEMERKILELQRQQVVVNEHKETAHKNICEMESSVTDIGIDLEDVELEFSMTLSAPW